MAEVIWWMQVGDGRDGHQGHWAHNGELWKRKVEMAFLPTLEDTVFLLRSDPDGGDGDTGYFDARPKRRYWNHDGTALLEFPHVIMCERTTDPEGLTSHMIMRGHYSTWREDDDLISELRASGWVLWGEDF